MSCYLDNHVVVIAVQLTCIASIIREVSGGCLSQWYLQTTLTKASCAQRKWC